MQIGIWELIIVGIILLLLFGRGKVSELMGDVGKGITAFKKGLTEAPAKPAETPVAPADPVPPTQLAPPVVPPPAKSDAPPPGKA